MKLDADPEEGIDDGLKKLTHRLQKVDPPGVCVSLGDQDQDGPPQFLRNLPSSLHILYYFHKLHQPFRFGGGGGLLPLLDRPCRATY